MKKSKTISKSEVGGSNVEQAAILFSCLSDPQKDALIELVKKLLEDNKHER